VVGGSILITSRILVCRFPFSNEDAVGFQVYHYHALSISLCFEENYPSITANEISVFYDIFLYQAMFLSTHAA
jgi:hypothetical protein